MAYNKYKIEHLQSKLNLTVKKEFWLPNETLNFEDDSILMGLLAETAKVFLGSEKARSEFIVTPILQSLNRKNKDTFSIFSGYEFNIDKSVELNGFCDFILSSPSNGFILEAPAFFVVETKKTDIDDNAFAQCGAELFAAQIFNKQKGKNQKVIYGCVTSGYTWAFLKLEDDVLSIDPNPVFLSFQNPYSVLSTLQWVLNKSFTKQKKA
jgi:hypothetical protein